MMVISQCGRHAVDFDGHTWDGGGVNAHYYKSSAGSIQRHARSEDDAYLMYGDCIYAGGILLGIYAADIIYMSWYRNNSREHIGGREAAIAALIAAFKRGDKFFQMPPPYYAYTNVETGELYGEAWKQVFFTEEEFKCNFQ